MTSPISNSARIAAELRAKLAEAYQLSQDDEAIDDTVSGECDLPDQIAAMAREVGRTEAFAKALAELIKGEQDRKARLEHRAEKLRALIAWAMQESGFRKLPFPDMTLTLSAGKPPLIVDDIPLTRIPPEFKKMTETLDKAKIRDALNVGFELSFACLGNPSPTLTIRRG